MRKAGSSLISGSESELISLIQFITWDACAAHVIKWGPFVSTNAHLSIINSF